MRDLDRPIDELVGKEVHDATGTLLGTVSDVDEDGRVLYVTPDPDPTEDAWAEVARGHYVNYDNDWLGVPDYTVWSEGDADDVGFEEWPYTVTVDEIGDVSDDAITLEGVSLTDLVPFLGDE